MKGKLFLLASILIWPFFFLTGQLGDKINWVIGIMLDAWGIGFLIYRNFHGVLFFLKENKLIEEVEMEEAV